MVLNLPTAPEALLRVDEPAGSMRGARALIAELETASRSGATEDELFDVLLASGWRPQIEPVGTCDVLDGVLDTGRHVPVRIYHHRPQGDQTRPQPDATISSIDRL